MNSDHRLGPAPSNEGRVQRIEASIARHVDFSPSGDGWLGIPELPAAEELLRQQWEVRDPPENDVTKPYSSKEEYLAALHGILRVEGTEGLRFAVNKVRENPEMMEDGSIAIYTDVRAKGYLVTNRGSFCRISFSTRRAGAKIRWEQSRRLLPGTVVAITTAAQPFQKGMKVAVVAQRPFEDGLELTPPEIDLLWADTADAAIDPEEVMLMVEYRGSFFESVRHTMVGLQHVGNSETISPLDKYLVSADKTSSAPLYRQQQPEIDYAPLVAHAKTPDEKLQALLSLRGMTGFPSPLLEQVSTLDSSQLDALRRIVHDELAIIQGPPGTGKTFTSVSALKVLLASRQPASPPIIVAAQTNHALDQLLQYMHDAGAKIARLGGRTSSPIMKERTLFHLQREAGMRHGKEFRLLQTNQTKLTEHMAEIVRAAVPSNTLIHPDDLLKYKIITKAQHESIVGDGNDKWESSGNDDDLGPFHPWLGPRIIPFVHSTQILDFDQYEEQGDEEVEGEVDFDEDDDLELGKTEDGGYRIRGTFVPIIPGFTGRLPESQKKRKVDAKTYLEQCDDLWDIPDDIRGAVYRYFQSRMAATMAVDFRGLCDEIEKNAARIQKYKWSRSVQLIEHKDLNISIVGCTTTGLTKYRGLIAALEPVTLLIEEAAETREANITAAIYPTLQQLILVGDHQQLTPQSDVKYLTNTRYNINVSMFERLVGLELPYTMLTHQRRMRPELSYIVRYFYQDLVDHPIVLDEANRPNVPGMGGRNAWFFDHTWPEDRNADTSRSNLAEAEMIVKFFAYLTQNGVPAKDITILTYYNGQRKALLRLLKRDETIVRGEEPEIFKVFTVDSYQGEENEIILLSIVRSPSVGERYAVGFLDSINRAVVAISRARRGFYLFGNVDNVLKASKESWRLWAMIFNGFADQDLVARDNGLPIHCAKHDETNWIAKPDDFMGIAGGCRTKCDGKMIPCGHDCKLNCHTTPHDRLPCLEPCIKTLHCGHPCINRCVDLCACRCRNFRPPPPPVVRLPGNQRDQRQPLTNQALARLPGTQRDQRQPFAKQSLALRYNGQAPGQNQRRDRNNRLVAGGQARVIRSDTSDTSSVSASVAPSSIHTPSEAITEWNHFASNPTSHDAELNRSHREQFAAARAEAAQLGPVQLTQVFRETRISDDGKSTNSKVKGVMTKIEHQMPPPTFPLSGSVASRNSSSKTVIRATQRTQMPMTTTPTPNLAPITNGSATVVRVPPSTSMPNLADPFVGSGLGFEAEVLGTYNMEQTSSVNSPELQPKNADNKDEAMVEEDEENLIDL